MTGIIICIVFSIILAILNVYIDSKIKKGKKDDE